MFAIAQLSKNQVLHLELNFLKIKFQNRNISLNNLRNWTFCWKVCEKGIKPILAAKSIIKTPLRTTDKWITPINHLLQNQPLWHPRQQPKHLVTAHTQALQSKQQPMQSKPHDHQLPLGLERESVNKELNFCGCVDFCNKLVELRKNKKQLKKR